MPKVWDSSTVMTPSLPTLSIASAMMLPTSSSSAEMAATRAISSLLSISLERFLMSVTAMSTALSIPRRICIGFAPAATLRRPSLTMACASTVAVVVPSPATSLVFVATALASWAPMFSEGSSSSISRAMVTPSFVMVGAPNFFSSTTLRPLGPSVTLTASASLVTPASRARRASSSYSSILAIFQTPLSLLLRLGRLLLCKYVPLAEDQDLFAADLYLGAAVLRVDDGVAYLDVQRDQFAFLIPTRSNGQYLALLGLLLGGIGNHDTAGCLVFALTGRHDYPVSQRFQVHVHPSSVRLLN